MRATGIDGADFSSGVLVRMADLYSPGASFESFGVKQWMEFCGWMTHNNILMCLVPQLKRVAPVPVVRKLEEAVRIHERMMWRRVDILKGLADAAKSEHLSFMLVKGMALSQELYGNAFARQSGDIDILVDCDDTPKADYVLRKAGWTCPGEAHKVRRMVNNGMPVNKALNSAQAPYPLRSSRFLPHVTNYFYRHNNGRVDTLELHDRFYALSGEQCSALLANSNLLDVGGCKVAVPSRPAHMLLTLLSLHEDVESVHANVTGRPSNGLKGVLDAAVWLRGIGVSELAELEELALAFDVQPYVQSALGACETFFPGVVSQPFSLFEAPKSAWSAPLETRMLNPTAAAESGARDALEAVALACEGKRLRVVFDLEGQWGAIPAFAGGSPVVSGFSFRALRINEKITMSLKVPTAFAMAKNDLALMFVVLGRGAAGQEKAAVVSAACFDDEWKANVVAVSPGRIDVHAGIMTGGQPLDIREMPDGSGGLKVEFTLIVDFAAAFAVPSVHIRVYGSLYRELAGATLVELVQSAMAL